MSCLIMVNVLCLGVYCSIVSWAILKDKWCSTHLLLTMFDSIFPKLVPVATSYTCQAQPEAGEGAP